MATGVNSVLNIGKGALFASQAAIQTVGNNIANVNTEGYSRQAVRFETWPEIDYFPGQMGQGVKAAEVMRYFDKFVERNYLQKNGDYTRWTAMSSNMGHVETIFNESSGLGVGGILNTFFSSWEKLSQFPDDPAGRQALISNSQTLAEAIKAENTALRKAEETAQSMVREEVTRANQLMEAIANLNVQIEIHYVQNKNNPNSLLDERDALTRELSGLIDVDVIDRGGGKYIITSHGGCTLVDGRESFALSYDGPMAFQTKSAATTFDGELKFSGQDGYEYHLEFTSAGALGSGSAKFKVSLDGGRTWVTDANGNVMEFEANDKNKPVKVKDLEIWFEPGSNSSFIVGDRFTVVPKNALYWIQPTNGPLLISPMEQAEGALSKLRATGGAIAGNLVFLDYQAAKIRDQLDEFSKNLIWEVNRVHSQGAGLDRFTQTLGDYRVRDTSYSLNSPYIGQDFPWGERLQAGSFSIALFDPLTGESVLTDPGMQNALTINFDPSWSLDDLVRELRDTDVTWMNAGVATVSKLGSLLNIDISDNRLLMETGSSAGYAPSGQVFSFGFGDDSAGLLAALGVNTYFKGDASHNINVNEQIVQNINLINAGRINGGGELNNGDNLTAREIGALVEKNLVFTDWTGRSYTRTLPNYYSSIVSSVGSMAANANFNQKATQAAAQQLKDRQEEISGVNLDEEMSSLIRFQSSYKAAAKLITTADEMFQTLLGLKN